MIQLVWLSPGTFDLVRSVILVGNTELCVLAVRADQQEYCPPFEPPLFKEGDSSSCQGEIVVTGMRVGTGPLKVMRSKVSKDLAVLWPLRNENRSFYPRRDYC